VEKQKLWSRMGQWFRSSSPGPVRTEQVAASPGTSSAERISSAVVPRSDRPERGSRSSETLHGLERLEQQQVRVAGLVESIQDHLTAQSQRTDSIARSLEKLADSLAHLPEWAQTQTGYLEKISDEVTRNSGSTQRLESTLSQMPQLADAQREAMVSIGAELSASRTAHEQLASTLGSVRDVVTEVGEITTTSTASMKEFRNDLTTRENRVAKLVEEQTGGLYRFAWILVGVAGAILVVSIIGVIVGR